MKIFYRISAKIADSLQRKSFRKITCRPASNQKSIISSENISIKNLSIERVPGQFPEWTIPEQTFVRIMNFFPECLCHKWFKTQIRGPTFRRRVKKKVRYSCLEFLFTGKKLRWTEINTQVCLNNDSEK